MKLFYYYYYYYYYSYCCYYYYYQSQLLCYTLELKQQVIVVYNPHKCHFKIMTDKETWFLNGISSVRKSYEMFVFCLKVIVRKNCGGVRLRVGGLDTTLR